MPIFDSIALGGDWIAKTITSDGYRSGKIQEKIIQDLAITHRNTFL